MGNDEISLRSKQLEFTWIVITAYIITSTLYNDYIGSYKLQFPVVLIIAGV